MEHLRYVARARGADPAALVRETAHALSSLRFDPSGLVVACRRIVERHPDCAPLWWLCAHLLTAPDPFELAWELADEIDHDPTPRVLGAEVPDDATVVTVGFPELAGAGLMRRGDLHVLVVDSRHQGSSFLQRLERADVRCDPVQAEAVARAVEVAELVVIEALAVSPDRMVAPIGSAPLLAVAAAAEVPVWLVAGAGRRLPDAYVGAIGDRLSVGAEAWELDHDEILLDTCLNGIASIVGPTGRRPLADGIDIDCPFAPELLRTSAI